MLCQVQPQPQDRVNARTPLLKLLLVFQELHLTYIFEA